MSNSKRTALITGSGKNIGKAIALGLAKDGYNVVINGSTNEDLCNDLAKFDISLRHGSIRP